MQFKVLLIAIFFVTLLDLCEAQPVEEEWASACNVENKLSFVYETPHIQAFTHEESLLKLVLEQEKVKEQEQCAQILHKQSGFQSAHCAQGCVHQHQCKIKSVFENCATRWEAAFRDGVEKESQSLCRGVLDAFEVIDLQRHPWFGSPRREECFLGISIEGSDSCLGLEQPTLEGE
ncbi:MAG: hypothetical protein HYS98_02080 [Deltaproteobacteria bacterium]|nr:hypothetical protein [Deltaproteobacteria bacterium]